MIISIPAYWNYSISYQEMSSICVFQYRTYMNTIAVLPDLIMHLLQKNNVKRKTLPQIDKISENKGVDNEAQEADNPKGSKIE